MSRSDQLDQSVWTVIRTVVPNAKRRLLLVAIVSATAGMAEAAVLILVVQVTLTLTDSARADSNLELPLGLPDASPGGALAIAGGLAVCLLALHWASTKLSTLLASEALRNARIQVIDAFTHARWSRQALVAEGVVQETAFSLANQTSVVVLTTAQRLAAAASLVVLLGAAAIVNIVVMVGVVAVGALLVVALRPLSIATRRHASSLVEANGELNVKLAQLSGMAMEARVFGVESALAADLGVTNDLVASRHRTSRFSALFGAIAYRDIAILALVGGIAAMAAGDPGDFAQIGAVVLLIVRSLGYASMVNSTTQQLNEQLPNVLRFAERVSALELDLQPPGSIAVDSIGTLAVDAVSYSYDGTNLALDGVSITIPEGSIVGLIGPSGGGKSTLLQVLLRLRSPSSGVVRVGTTDIADVDDRAWTDLVSFVPQEPSLIAATIAENVRFMRASISDSAVREALARAGILGEVTDLPDGIDTRLGPRGSGLSGGQRQRIALARALAGNPDLLVLDEPTSALDADSEVAVRSTLEQERGRTTMVIATHRPAILTICDRVFAVRDGSLVDVTDRPVSAADLEVPD